MDEAPVSIDLALAAGAALLGGAALLLGFIWLVGSERLSTELLMDGAVALVLGMLLFLVQALNNPFQGDVRAEPEPLEAALAHFAER